MEQGVLLTLGRLAGTVVLVARSIDRLAVVAPLIVMRLDIACIT